MAASRRTTRSRRLSLEDREDEAALRSRTALNEQAPGPSPVFGEARVPIARHNPFCHLGNGALRTIEILAPVVILAVGFGYLVPAFTWPVGIVPCAALAGILACCACAVLASQRLAENRHRLASASLHWKVSEAGIFVSTLDAAADTVNVQLLAWTSIALTDNQRGRITLLDAQANILGDLDCPDRAHEIMAEINRVRTYRSESHTAAGRGPRIEPRFDYPERLEDTGPLPHYRIGEPVDLDRVRHSPRIEKIEKSRVEPHWSDAGPVVDAVLVELPAAPDAPIALDEPEAFPDETKGLGEPVAVEVPVVDPEPRATPAAVESDDGVRQIFEPIRAEVVPEAVRVQHAATTTPVPVDTSRVLPSNDESRAQAVETVMNQLIADLKINATAAEAGASKEAYFQDSVAPAGEANGNDAGRQDAVA